MAAVAKHAPNKDAAIKLLEFLVSDEGQQLYADANFEYPIKAGVAPNAIVIAFGPLEPDPLSLEDIASHRRAATDLVDKTGFDN